MSNEGSSEKTSSSAKRWRDLPFAVQWRALFVRLPRLTPRIALRILAPEGPYPFIVKVPSRRHEPIPVWIFLPPVNKVSSNGYVPVHLDFHGGGFYQGSCFEQAPFCAKVARERGCVVLCPDFRQGPLHQFQSALEDSEDVLQAVLDTDEETDAGRILYEAISKRFLPKAANHRELSSITAGGRLRIEKSRLSLSGWSSGGNVALNLVLTVEHESQSWPCLIPDSVLPIPVILFYPSLHQLQLPEDRPRPRHVPKPGRFARSLDRHLVPTYLPEHLRTHPRANPGLVDPKYLHPKVHLFLVITEKDTLLEQMENWTKVLQHSEHNEYDGRLDVFRAKGMKHGYANFPERMLNRKEFKMKRKAYEHMMAFWDKVYEEKKGKDASAGNTSAGDTSAEDAPAEDDPAEDASPVQTRDQERHSLNE